jgi:heavy metal translocating P-type ATPase
MELLIVIGAVAAWLVSMASVLRGQSAVYFDSAVAALVLATFGRYLEAKARSRASQLVGHLLEPSTKPIRAASSDGAEMKETAPAAIEPGMAIAVSAGEVVPVDARLTAPAEVSLGVITGESAPVTLQAGEEVPAGATPLSGELRARALRPAASSTLELLARQAQDLRERRAGVQRTADRLATWLTPLITAIAIATLVYWGRASSWPQGIEAALAVVLVACPCTYGVITPLIMWLTLRHALTQGVCIRHAQVVEAMSEVTTVAFDKTGTLTEPLSAVVVHRHDSHDARASIDVAGLVGALEADDRHPIGRALARWAEERRAALTQRRLQDGQGVVATDEAGQAIALGSPRLMHRLGVTLPPSARDRAALLAVDGELVASFEVDEAIRDDAQPTLNALREAGLSTVVLTGDRHHRAQRLGETLGVEAHGELTATEKVQALEELGGRPAIVGDGVNDALASAAAAVSVAVAGAAGLNRGLADVTLLREDLRLVPWTLALTKRATRLARRTLAAATAYNLVFITLAASGLLRPIWAGLSMLAASLLALGSALRIAQVPGLEPHSESGDATSKATAPDERVMEVAA